MSKTQFYPETLVEAAMEATDLNDFGELPCRPGLAVLCETYDRNIRDAGGRNK